MTTAAITTLNPSIRFHYIRNRNPKLLRKLADGSISKGVPLACVASLVDRENKTIEYAVATAHSRRTERKDTVFNSSDMGLSDAEFAGFVGDLTNICAVRGVRVKVGANKRSARIIPKSKSFDTFSYDEGRKIAIGRLDVSPLFIRYEKEPKTSLEILRLIMKAIVDDSDTSTRVKFEARNWLAFKSSIEIALEERDTVRALPVADPRDELVPEARQFTPVKRVPRFAVNYER